MDRLNQVKHLCWRAGFGTDYASLKSFSNEDSTSLVDRLLEEPYERVSKELKIDIEDPLRSDYVNALRSNWIERMINSTYSLREKMALFWHNHFSCSSRNVDHLESYLDSIRSCALGSFREMVHQIAKEPAMIIYLNNQQNLKGKPNENFARELMELFCLGRDVLYKETDIKEAARAFTGWRVNKSGEYHFDQRKHDFGEKTFLGKTSDFRGEEIIDIILEHRESAVFLSEKLYKYLINPVPNQSFIERMADIFFESDYNIKELLLFVFTSSEFYKEENVGVKVKSPMELFIGLCRVLKVSETSTLFSNYVQKKLGQKLFSPPNVAGWPGNKNWITSSSILLRLRLGEILLVNADLDSDLQDSIDIYDEFKIPKKIKVGARLDSDLLSIQLSGLRFEELAKFLLQVEIEDKIDEKREADLISSLKKITGLPEFQMC